MSEPTTIGEARKQNQLDRLARKENMSSVEDALAYADWYGKQPAEMARAELHKTHGTHLVALKAAAETVGIAEITGKDLEQARHDHAVAVLVAERSVVPSRGAGVKSSLTSGG